MKKLVFFLMVLACFSGYSQVGINNDGSTPNSSAMLDVKSTTMGILIPRLTQAQRNAIVSPATGLIISQTDNNPGLYYYDGSNWVVVNAEALTINDLLDAISDGQSVFLGSGAGVNDDGYNYNVALGLDALNTNISGNNNTATGYQAMFSNTSGRDNTANGYKTLYSNTTGISGTAAGREALYNNTSGLGNTADGYKSLYTNTEGEHNTAAGYTALYLNSTGDYNTAIGSNALYVNSTGQRNTAIGYKALDFNSTGNYNTAAGVNANFYNQEGSENTIIGYMAGMGTGPHNKSGNVFLGYKAGSSEHGSNKLYIENSNSSTPLIWGDFVNDSVRINGTLDINNAFAFPTIDGTTGQILQTNGSGTLSWSANPGATALQWADTSNQLATDYDVSQKQNISDTSSVDATRYWVGQQGFSTVEEINDLSDGKTGGNSVFLGSGAGQNDNGPDNQNVAVGINALRSANFGDKNVAMGFEALYSNSTGDANTAIGYQALRSHLTTNSNTAVGYQVLYSSTYGASNAALGRRALYENTTGSYNTALGNLALNSNTTAHHNTAVGYKAMSSNTTGFENTAIGYQANSANEEGSYNTMIGFEAGNATIAHNKSGNVFLGYKAGYNDITDNKLYIENSDSDTPLIWGDFANDSVKINGTFNIAGAYSFPVTDGTSAQVLQTDGSGTLSWGDGGVTEINDLTDGKTDATSVFLGSGAGANDNANNKNVAIGIDALNTNTTGANNTATGYQALYSNTTGLTNTADGKGSLYSNTSGCYNTANGYHALYSNKTGSSNTATGHEALRINTGYNNTATGRQALNFNTSGADNTATGLQALYANITGQRNTATGNMASHRNTTGNNNTAIGKSANSWNSGGSNNTIIGYEAGNGTGPHSKSGNVFLGYQAGYNDYGSNLLYIENSNSATPLIWGDFANDTVRINGTLDIASAFHFPVTDGTSGQVLQTDGSGVLTWSDDGGATEINDLSDGKTGGNSVFLGSGAGENDDGSDNWNTAVGDSALNANTTGDYNTAAGYYTLYSNVSGHGNTAIGHNSLASNTSGDNNTATGRNTLSDNTTGHSKTAVGYSVLNKNTTGNFNTAIGLQALDRNLTGTSNTASGYQTLFYNTTGYYNSAFGRNALRNNTTGYQNVAYGYEALFNNTLGNSNMALGHKADYYNQEGTNNTIIGYEAGYGSGTHNKSGNVFLGYQAGYSETGDNKLYIENSNSSTPLIWGDFANDTVRINGTFDIAGAYHFPMSDGTSGQVLQTDGSGVLNWGNGGVTEINDLSDGKTGGKSVFLGTAAGNGDDGSDNKNVGVGDSALYTNSTGSANTANGFYALYSNTTGFNNTANGSHALKSNTSANSNVANGYCALIDNTTGSENTASGERALFKNVNGNRNTAIGALALYTNLGGDYNTAIGYSANHYSFGGSKNTIIGYQAGKGTSSHSKSGCVLLGYQAGYNEHDSNRLYIENSNSTDPLIYGEFDNNIVAVNGKLGIGTESPDTNLHIVGRLKMVDGNEGSGKVLTSDANGVGYWATSTATDNDWKETSDSLMRIVGNDTLVTITNSGKIGIGTTDPLYKLDIFGGNMRLKTNDYSQLTVRGSTVSGMLGSNGPSGFMYLGSHSNHELRFLTNNTNAMVIKTNGDVGVGTLTPDEKFEVEFGTSSVDVEIGRGTSNSNVTFITLRSPDGTKYYVTVDDAGNLVTSTTKP